MPVVKIRHARPSDLDGIEVLENRAFSGDRLSRRSMRRLAGAPSAILRVAASGNMSAPGAVIAGYHLVLLRKGSRVARLYSIAVDAGARGGGIGRLLLADAEAMAGKAGRNVLRLEVRRDNAAAIRLYEREGYRRIGAYPAYYADGADALRFEKTLPSRQLRNRKDDQTCRTG